MNNLPIDLVNDLTRLMGTGWRISETYKIDDFIVVTVYGNARGNSITLIWKQDGGFVKEPYLGPDIDFVFVMSDVERINGSIRTGRIRGVYSSFQRAKLSADPDTVWVSKDNQPFQYLGYLDDDVYLGMSMFAVVP